LYLSRYCGVQQRNKPKEPPKAPEKAPFFLPTLPGVESRFAIEAKAETQPSKPTRRLEKAAAASESVFLKTLVDDDAEGDCEWFTKLSIGYRH
jgi:U3 small nucleolar RNA-associated protein 21